jgi:large subunit ribosomal protein L33
MAKRPTRIQIKLVSSEDTGYFYISKKNPKTTTNKLELKKYDPIARKHTTFREAKMK